MLGRRWERVGEEELGELALAEGDEIWLVRMLVTVMFKGGHREIPLSKYRDQTASADIDRDTSNSH